MDTLSPVHSPHFIDREGKACSHLLQVGPCTPQPSPAAACALYLPWEGMCHLGGWHQLGGCGIHCDTPLLSLPVPPTILGSNETTEVVVMEGRPARLLCEARGNPSPDIIWFKDGAPLAPSTEATYSRGGRQLQLGSSQGADAGNYTCWASNSAGDAEKTTRLEVYSEWGTRRTPPC